MISRPVTSIPVIAALLPRGRMLKKVDRLLRGTAELYAFPTWADFAAFLGTGYVDAAFIDPMVESGVDWGDRLQRLESSQRQRLILYTTLTPELASVLLHLGRMGIREVVFSRLDDGPQRLTEALALTGVRVINEWCPY